MYYFLKLQIIISDQSDTMLETPCVCVRPSILFPKIF